MGIFKKIMGKKNIKPGKLTKREKRQIYDMNSDIPLTDDTDILLTARNLPQTYLDRQMEFKKQRKTRKSSDSYGQQVTYLGDKKLSDFLDEVGIKLTPPVARGTRRRKTRKDKGKKHHMTKKHKKSRRYS